MSIDMRLFIWKDTEVENIEGIKILTSFMNVGNARTAMRVIVIKDSSISVSIVYIPNE